MKPLLIAAVATLVVSRLDLGPQSPPAPIGERVGAVNHGFTRIAGARELADGRVLILDNRERELRVAGLRTNTTSQVGRAGSGPTEYRSPAGLIALPDGRIWVARASHIRDSIVVYDVFDGAGRLARRVQMPPHRRIIAFGATNTLVVRTDENGLEYLEVYRR